MILAKSTMSGMCLSIHGIDDKSCIQAVAAVARAVYEDIAIYIPGNRADLIVSPDGIQIKVQY